MVDHFDDRRSKRTAYINPLQVKDLRSGEIYEAEMLDYSDGGISFASDVFFEKGTLLYFGIQSPPDYFTSRVFEYYKGEVVWSTDVKPSNFRYVYGVRLAPESNRLQANPNDAETIAEKRNHHRRSFSWPLRFASQKEIYDGTTKNISASGVFIAADENLEVGQIIELNLPLKKGKMVRTVGQIVRITAEGFALKFIEK